MLSWAKGLFDLDPPDEREFPNEINVSVQEVLMEGLRQIDEFNNLRDKLPDLHAKLTLCSPLNPPLRDLKPEEIDVIQLAHNFGHLETIINKSHASDLDTARDRPEAGEGELPPLRVAGNHGERGRRRHHGGVERDRARRGDRVGEARGEARPERAEPARRGRAGGP